jgi:hypothetical protein
MKPLTPVIILMLGLASGTPVSAQRTVPTCDDLAWSAQVRADNPDITEACQGVYQRGDEYFAKITIEITRVTGDRLTFRPRHVDGSLGRTRSILVPNSWRARIDGHEYRASELLPGQELSVYIPEDRFAISLGGGTGDDDLLPIESER